MYLERWDNSIRVNLKLKFRYCEKARKFEIISHLVLKLLSDVKTKREIFLKLFWPSQNIWTLHRVEVISMISLKYKLSRKEECPVHYFFYLFHYLIANLYPVDSKFHGFHTLGDNLVKIYQYAMRKGDLID